jgi:hypothetical protein
MSKSAVQVRSSALRFACKSCKNKDLGVRVGGFVSSGLYPKASSLGLVLYKCVQCTAGGVDESSGIDRLTDVPECREDKFSEAPRKEKP